MEGSSQKDKVNICRMMHLLDRDDCLMIDMVPQVIKDVYDNFTSMIDVVEDAKRKYEAENDSEVNLLVELQKDLIAPIRWALKWCVSDVGVLNRKLFDLLTRIEAHFIEITQLLIHDQTLDEWVFDDKIIRKADDLRSMDYKILIAYLSFEKTCKPSIFTLSEKLVMERLDQVIKKDETYFGRIQKRHKNHCIILKRLIDNITHHGNWEDICPWVERVLDDMPFLEYISWRKDYSKITKQRIDAAIQKAILHIFVWQPDSSPLFTNELLVAYLDCFRKNLIWLLRDVDHNLTEDARGQFNVIQDVLKLVLSLGSDMDKHENARVELSHTKVYVETALVNLGCIMSSFLDKELDGYKVSSEISDCLSRVFEALLLPLEFDGYLSNQTLIRYACYFRHYRFQMPTSEDTAMKSSHFPLVFMARAVFYEWTEYHIEREMLDNVRVEMFGVLRDLGSIIGKSLNNAMEGKVVPMEMNPALTGLIAQFERVKMQFTQTVTLTTIKELSLQNPATDLVGFLNFLHRHLEELRTCNKNLVTDWKDQVQIIQEHLVVFRSFLQNSIDNGIKDDRLQDVPIRIRNAAYTAEYIINGIAARAFHPCCRSFLVSDVIEQSNQIKEIIIKVSSDVSTKKLPVQANNLEKEGIRFSSRASIPPTDVVVGFEVEIKLLMERLASDKKQLDVIPVVGMPGLGKTTLAKKVYEDPYIASHFQLRSWCSVSQDYIKEDLLLSILGTEGSRQMSCEELSLLVHQKLKGRKYLIILDDVWDMDVFEYLYRFFPNDDNGSRIVLTSRIHSMGDQSNPLVLHLLSDDETWNMLKRKVYPEKECPLELIQIGKEIARKCGGLPLAVSVVAGILAKSDKEQDVWKEIAERLNIYSADDSEGEGMKALDLSYELLPDHLKPLFLYVGAFPEDYNIPAEKLKWLWIAEGFVRKTKFFSLEAQAEAHLMDLIDRSLLMVAERKSNGSVKSCSIHDLMRDMTLSKSKEESFLQHIDQTIRIPEQLMYQRRVCASLMWKDREECNGTPTRPRPTITYEDLSRISLSSRVNSIILFSGMGLDVYSSEYKELTKSIFRNHKMLRVLDVDRLELYESFFTNERVPLHLRYISFDLRSYRVPSPIFNLWDLETLIIRSQHEITVPIEVWKMVKLRNLHVGLSTRFTDAEDDSIKLENIRTLSRPDCHEDETSLIGRFPNVQKLSIILSDGKKKISELPSILATLHQLESLKMECHTLLKCWATLNLPSTLKQLSLNSFGLKWNDISSLQELPNLEVLKLKHDAVRYTEELWDMGQGEFPRLKVLKFDGLSIKWWIAGPENFPCLQNLSLDSCLSLKEIPSSFGDICGLEKIQVHRCSHTASESAKLIQEEQEDFGNDLLKIYISDSFPPEGDKSDKGFGYGLADEPYTISDDEPAGGKLDDEPGYGSGEGLPDEPNDASREEQDDEPDNESGGGGESVGEWDNECGGESLGEWDNESADELGGEWNNKCGDESGGEWDDDLYGESDEESLDYD